MFEVERFKSSEVELVAGCLMLDARLPLVASPSVIPKEA
jgi:hypothetical protein